jgi:hypothetical protein
MRQFLILFYQAQGYSLNQSIELVNKNYDYLMLEINELLLKFSK